MVNSTLRIGDITPFRLGCLSIAKAITSKYEYVYRSKPVLFTGKPQFTFRPVVNPWALWNRCDLGTEADVCSGLRSGTNGCTMHTRYQAAVAERGRSTSAVSPEVYKTTGILKSFSCLPISQTHSFVLCSKPTINAVHYLLQPTFPSGQTLVPLISLHKHTDRLRKLSRSKTS